MAPAVSPNSPMAMNSRLAMITLAFPPGSLEQVDGGEQADPDHVDEVPVVGGHLDGVVVAGGELPERARSSTIRMNAAPPATWAPWKPVRV